MGLDKYSFQARLIPVAAVLLPPLVLLGTGVITSARLGVASGVITAALGALASQLGRDRGRALEPALWASWGGSPTLQRLRYSGSSNPARVQRLHQRLERVTGETLPTADEESADPLAADDRYDEVSARLRALTYDHDRFASLFAENINYGQRRNLLGLKPAGIVFSILTCAASCIVVGVGHGEFSDRLQQFWLAATVSLLMLGFWVFVVQPHWVRVPAEAYADQFVGAVDRLDHESATA